jgi:hypothetical protein
MNAATQVRRGADAGLAALRALIPLARRVASLVRVFAIVAAISGFVMVAVAVRSGLPSSSVAWVALGFIAAVAFTPPVIIWWFSSALLDALALPDRLASSPELVRAHGRDLTELARTAHAEAGSVRSMRLRRGDVARAARLLLRTRTDLPTTGGALRLVSVPFLLTTAFAALVALLVIVMAPLTVVVAALVG